MGYDSPAALVKLCRCPAPVALGKQDLANTVGITRRRLNLVSSTDFQTLRCLICTLDDDDLSSKMLQVPAKTHKEMIEPVEPTRSNIMSSTQSSSRFSQLNHGAVGYLYHHPA